MVVATDLIFSPLSALGNCTGIAPMAINVEVVRTMVSSTSITSTNGITFILSNPFSSIFNVPLHKDNLCPAQQQVVNEHSRDGNQEAHRRHF